MGSRRAVIGWGSALLLSCGGSDRVTLGSLPDAAAGSGGAIASEGAAGAGFAGAGGSGGSPGRVREGSPSVDGIVGAGGGGWVALDAGAANAPDGGRAGAADAGALGNGGAPGRGGASGDDAGAGGVAGAGVAGAGGAGMTGAGGSAGVGGGSAGAAGAAGAADGSAGAAGAGGSDTVVVSLGPTSLGLFAPPIDSSRYAVAGYDAAAGVCVSIIWDYSNNGLELERHCDDFGQYVSFPYVLVGAAPAEACASSWGYVGLQPSAASGCIDPVEGLVNVRLEVESEGVRYEVSAVNEPDLVGL